MSWTLLVLAGLLEVAWVALMPATAGFTRLWPSVATIVALVASMWLLALAVRTLPIGTAYAVWVGIGATGAAVIGVVLYREALPPMRALCLVLLVASIVGLKLTTPTTEALSVER